MVTMIAPAAIVLGVVGTVGLLIYTLWERFGSGLERFVGGFATELERADLKIGPERVVAIIVGLTAVFWLITIVIVRPDPIRALLMAPIAFAISAMGFQMWLKRKVNGRLKAFTNQLELALRLISSGLRVGLSLRQALVLVIDEMPDPARMEFARIAARTNIGVTLDDALDDLVRRLPSEELRMMVDAIKVQTQTGGNLAKILDHLASTIKARRQIARKVLALTGEAKMSGWVIGSLPILLGLFIIGTQPSMRTALLNTGIGHGSLLLFCVLEGAGVIAVRAMMKLDV